MIWRSVLFISDANKFRKLNYGHVLSAYVGMCVFGLKYDDNNEARQVYVGIELIIFLKLYFK